MNFSFNARLSRKKALLFIGVPILMLIVVIVVLRGFVGKKNVAKTTTDVSANVISPNTAKALELLTTDVMTIAPVILKISLRAAGTITASTQNVVKSYVSGQIKELRVKEGQTVKKGDIVAVFDSRENSARLEQANSNLNATEGQVSIAQKNFENARTLLEQGVGSKNSFENAQNQLEIAKANAAAAKASVAVAQKAMDDVVLRAAVGGMVSNRYVQVGEKVSPDSKLVEIVDLSELVWETTIPSSQIVSIVVGQQVNLAAVGVAQTLTAKITRISPSTLAGSRSVPVFAQLTQIPKGLRTGLFAEGQIILRAQKQLAIPEAALQKRGFENFVYTVNGNVIKITKLTVGEVGDVNGQNYLEVLSGLKEGDVVIKNNLGELKVDSRVKILPPA